MWIQFHIQIKEEKAPLLFFIYFSKLLDHIAVNNRVEREIRVGRRVFHHCRDRIGRPIRPYRILHLLADRLFRIAEQAGSHRFRKHDIIYHLQRTFGIAANKLLRENIKESVLGIKHAQPDIRDVIGTAVLLLPGYANGGGFYCRKLLTQCLLINFRKAFVDIAGLFIYAINTVDILRFRVRTVVRRFVIHPIKGGDETGKAECQTEDTGQRLRPVFPHIAKSDFQIKCQHNTIKFKV